MFSCLHILEAVLWFVLITLLNVSLIILTLSVSRLLILLIVLFFQAEDGIRDLTVTGVQTCALPIYAAVAETVADWARTPGTVGIRIMMTRGVSEDPADPGITGVLAAGARHGLPVNILCWGRLAQAHALAARNPNTSIVIDHLGLQQPFEPPPPAQPFADLPKVLELAACPNVAIKITGACTLSREAYPFKDIWDPLARIFDAFGIERCMWGTDWTRAVALLTYQQGVDAFRNSDRLSDSDKRTLLGGTLERVYKWSPKRGDR